MILGMKEVEANLKNALKIVSKNMDEALYEIGERGVGVTKQNTPVKEGRLRASMGYAIKNDIKGYEKDKSDTVKPDNSKNSVLIGTNVIYARKVEYMATNGSQGFFQRSYNQIAPIAKKIFETVLKRGL